MIKLPQNYIQYLMKTLQKISLLLITIFSLTLVNAQRKKKAGTFKKEMTAHYQQYYQLMLENNDVNGAIESLNHLIILQPSKGKKDTLGALYLQKKLPFLALKTVGESNTILAFRTKANAFKMLKNIKKAIEMYEKIVEQTKSVTDVYELAQLQFGLQRFAEAKESVEYGIQKAKDEKVRIFVKENNYLETSIKAALFNILGLIEYNLNKNDTQKAIAYFDEALKIDPNFILATENKKAILAKK